MAVFTPEDEQIVWTDKSGVCSSGRTNLAFDVNLSHNVVDLFVSTGKSSRKNRLSRRTNKKCYIRKEFNFHRIVFRDQHGRLLIAYERGAVKTQLRVQWVRFRSCLFKNNNSKERERPSCRLSFNYKRKLIHLVCWTDSFPVTRDSLLTPVAMDQGKVELLSRSCETFLWLMSMTPRFSWLIGPGYH